MYRCDEHSRQLIVRMIRFYDGFFEYLEGFEGGTVLECVMARRKLMSVEEIHNPPLEIFKVICLSTHQFRLVNI